MPKTQRQMIQIDEEKCNGCGNCLTGCPEGALALVGGKARLVKESYCDGLGACLGHCPTGALVVVASQAEAYDESGVIAHLQMNAPDMLEKHLAHLREHAPDLVPPAFRQRTAPAASQGGCPGAQIHLWDSRTEAPAAMAGRAVSELRQWPVQLRLVPVGAPFFENANLTLIADCVPFANPNMHADFVKDSAIAIGCPKLDDAQAYVEKLTQILQANDIRSLRVAFMEVPCCRGLVWIGEQALARSGKDIPFTTTLVPIGL